ncbi:MAG TPA: type I polyketide synthase, partial [Haliangium sp.]|nr:type I polyketide synthase [Haliangium sp.]
MERDQTDNRIAIIGMACRFPGAPDVASFWANLCAGKESLEVLSDDVLRAAGVPSRDIASPDYVKVAGVIEDADRFDASFFYLSAREAEKMDPQLRVFLEGAWRAIESAGYNSENFDGSIGVFAGALGNTYLLANAYNHDDFAGGSIHAFMNDMALRMGNDSNYLATRASYHLNLTGPSVTVQTACSTSLVAAHLACQSLLAGECDLALAGGVSLRFPMHAGYRHTRDSITSPDGHCRPFDAGARGTLFGNGMGVVVLKRLDEALADGDTIWAVIAGSAIGNDGSNKVGFTAPGIAGQTEVLAQALAVAEVEPGSVSHIETHGTGTAMGDPIEFAALTQAYGRQGAPCALGSVKANFGHLSTAAGVAGLIKTVLMLHHRQIPALLHFSSWNPECDHQGSRFYIPTALTPWDGPQPLRAGLSSFGMGGTNAHMVLEEAPTPARSGPSRPMTVLPLSAKSPQALEAARSAAVAHLRAHPDLALADVAYTYAMGRRTFNHRLLVVAADTAQAAHLLETSDPGSVFTGSGQPANPPVVFMFPGQGAQHAQMGQDCYENEPVYRDAVDECASLLAPHAGYDIRDLLYPRLRGLSGPADDLRQTRYTQPALFVVEYALARLWMSWGIEPEAMVGHSVGEYVAACLAGVFTLEDALRVVAERGRLVQELPAGSMAAALATPEALAPYLDHEVSIAAINEPAVCTISGPSERLAAVVERLQADGITCRPVQTSHAFHSRMMDPAVEGLRALLAGIRLRPMKIPFVSNVTGTWITEEQAMDPGYWARHLREPVLFARSAAELFQRKERVFLEVGPGQTLASFVRRHPDRETGQLVVSTLGQSRGKGAAYANLLKVLGQFWLAGVTIDWRGFYAGQQRRRLPLPTYPFERLRYWIEPPRASGKRGARVEVEKLDLDEWFHAPSWRQVTSAPEPLAAGELAGPWLVFADEHGVAGRLCDRLAGHGARLTVVTAGEEYGRTEAGRHVIRPAETADYARLIGELVAGGALPAHVVHLWSVDDDDDGDAMPSVERFEAWQARGVYSLVCLVKALGEHGVTAPMAIDVVTSNARIVTGQELSMAEKSTADVACRVISQEHPQWRCRSIDIPAPSAPGSARVLDRLMRELLGRRPPTQALAVRGPYLWEQRYEPVRAERSDTPGRLRQGGVYLITGGLGEIGTTIGAMLVERYQARLALLVRDPLPPRDQWAAWLAGHPDDDETSLRIRRLERLEARRADVLVVNADVASEAEMRAALARVDERFGALHGVFHAAGLPGEMWDRTVKESTAEVFGWHFGSKAHGQIVLERLLAGRDIDFVFMMSSLAGVLGGLRLLPYGAANHFLDAAAQRANLAAGKSVWLSADWDVWQHHQDEKRAKSGIGAIMDDKAVQPEEGLEAIERILSLPDASQV